MTEVLSHSPATTPADPDLAAAVQEVLKDSSEPLTLSKIRSQLPSAQRQVALEDLAAVLTRLTAAGVTHQFPKYRSPQDRFWDRPMPVHIVGLLRATLDEQPLPWSELRRKLPAYAQGQAEAILREQVETGQMYRHPPLGSRGGERFGVRPPDPREPLRAELPKLFDRLEQLGYNRAELREAAMELLQEEEWTSPRTLIAAADPDSPDDPGPPSPASPPPLPAADAEGPLA